ncbi:type II toxin-antitoxin system RelE/ParE family toxin [Photobacterium proteolyticum]|uniref:type II toxin-antitoxin system RelE/ParE family toxin n=1 Tax=Photobacterium proteolyticum TaxID=1903952 RepID=UPI000ABCEE04|nr:type II toxin-antitoxin system RelE/ParE family toxin [Photobacterium proteolyticum]
MATGLIDADYGGHLYKKRVARPDQGKSGSYRTLIGARLGEQYFFLYLFEKWAKDNIDAKEEKALKQLAKLYLSQSPEWVRQQVEKGLLIQVDNK